MKPVLEIILTKIFSHVSSGIWKFQNFPSDTLGIQAGMNRPNALILAYPVISSGECRHAGSFQNLLGESPEPSLLKEMSLEQQVSEHTPPCFLWHTVSDELVPVENSLLFANALRKHQIPFELHLYPDGVHGLSLSTEETATPDYPAAPHIATWTPLCLEWLPRTFETL